MTTITTTLGKVKGLDEGNVTSFLGLRFGNPPIGKHRFLAPVAAPSWKGTFDATTHPNRAMQPQIAGTLGQQVPGKLDEDCLFLNIVTPSTEGGHRPVMVWIHGGGFGAGAANEYDGRVLAHQGDVVVVTINYRLGPFGYLDLSGLGDEFAGSGSNGFRDQILALQWVRENIADYGGDPGNVTIFGESAGGAAVLALLGAPSADGLFHRAIAHSPGGPKMPPGDRTESLAKKLGVDRSKLVEALRAMSAGELQAAGLGIGASVDGTVITRSPSEAIMDRGASGVPLIAGSNRNEGTLFTPGDDPPDTDPGRYDGANRGIATGLLDGADPTAYIEGIKAAYPDDPPKTIHEKIFVDMFRRPSIHSVERSTQAGPGGWLYRFDLPSTRRYNGKYVGATHASEMAFTFNAFADPDCRVFAFHDRQDPVAHKLAEQWSNTLIAFARNGDPNWAGLPNWSRYTEGNRSCMVLDETSRIEDDPDATHRKLWGDD